MNVIGNIIWLLLGGFATAIGYMTGGLVMMVTIIGIPFGIQMIKIGVLTLWPFGSTFEIRTELPGCLALLLNIFWLIVAGFWIALTHIVFGMLLFITIIGIPWGMQHFKLAAFAVAPFGKRVDIEG
jgi:uncharacterized membrane protein YccF (DUF307 family)